MNAHNTWLTRVARAIPEERVRLWTLYRIHVTHASEDHDTALASLNEQLDQEKSP
ncbi:hypothetical protein [Nocardiopsis sp. FR4]|uniref:hypothetical protein n=1 Tax=Nocardiopsis sp. FR4 TaxID=2605985 RepID=UPI00135B1909|nr:hypothetical protein [Nocardiopsis sp. FR4]